MQLPTLMSSLLTSTVRNAFVFASMFLLMVGSAAAQTSAENGSAGVLASSLDTGFGGVAAVGNGEVFVGSAPIGWQTGERPAGVVNRYARGDDGIWTEASSLSASDGAIGDHFGRSVAYRATDDVEMVVVGAPGLGVAYVFEKQNEKWRETAKLVPSVLADGVEFGGSYARGGYRTANIAITRDRVAVSAFGPDAEANAVHVFHRMGNSWMEEAILKPSGDAIEGFATAITAGDNSIFVAAPSANEGAGAIHVFDRDNAGWQSADVISVDDLAGRASFGQSLTFDRSEQVLLVGAPRQDGGGAVLAFKADDQGEWSEVNRVSPPERTDTDRRPASAFGSNLAASAGKVLIGARGAAFFFDGSTVVEIMPPDERSEEFFGGGLAINGDIALIGSPGADYEEGITNLYEYSQMRGDSNTGWQQVKMLANDIIFLESVYDEQVNCEEGEAEGFACSNVDLVSFMSSRELTSHRGVKMTDIWGWEDPETGKEWVLLGRTDGTAFIDISNPNRPVYVGQIYRTEGSPGSAWRDVKVYKNHAYIVADGADQHGVQIFDLTQLRDVKPAEMPMTFEETAHYAGTASTHNIVINEETGFAYAVGNRSGGENMCGGQLHIFDIREPANPKFAGCFSEGKSGTHDAQCVIYRGSDAEHAGSEICFASNGSSFVIADVTNKDSTVTVANTSYPNQAYTHQGWLTEDHNFFYMNDELDEMNGSVDRTRTLIWDVSDLDDPLLVKEFFLDSGASDHNLYVRDHFMYQSNYQAGLRILDISDPVNPVEVGNFDTTPFAGDDAGFGGSWSNYPYFKSGVIAVSSRGEGLFILKKRDTEL